MAQAHAVDTTKADRRDLSFRTTADLRRELDGLERAHRAGALRVTGNWTPGQNFAHIAKVIECSFDGFSFKMGLPIRLIGPLLRKRALRGSLPPGVKLRGGSRALEPDASVTFDEGLARLRAQLDRVDSGPERMQRRSPVLGRMSHEDWTELHLRHAELHLAFLDLGAPGA